MRELQPNPETGFLESRNVSLDVTRKAFNSPTKVHFLELANKYIDDRNYPDIDAICKNLGVSVRTFEQHLREDPVFNASWEECIARLRYVLTSKLDTKTNGKMGTLANLAMLRYLENRTWNQETKVQIKYDNGEHKNIFDAIEAEIVPNSTNIAPKLALSDGNSKPIDNQSK